MASTAKAAETLLQHIDSESEKHNRKPNYAKCIHLRMHDLHTVAYKSGEDMPMTNEAIN